MPVQDKTAITLGLGTLELGTYINGVFSAYSDVGALKSSVEVSISRGIIDFKTGRPQLSIIQEVVEEMVTIKATLAEITLATLKQVLGDATITSASVPTFLDGTSTAPTGNLTAGNTSVGSSDSLTFGGSDNLNSVGIRFTHVKLNGKRIIFEGWLGSPMGNLALPFRETDWTTYDAEFRLLADTTKPAGQMYFQLIKER